MVGYTKMRVVRIERERENVEWLTKDTGNRPDINPSGVMNRAKENLRGSVPESNNLMSVALERDAQGVTEAEINDLKNTLVLVKENVMRLNISVKDIMDMAVNNTLSVLGDFLWRHLHRPQLIATRRWRVRNERAEGEIKIKNTKFQGIKTIWRRFSGNRSRMVVLNMTFVEPSSLNNFIFTELSSCDILRRFHITVLECAS